MKTSSEPDLGYGTGAKHYRAKLREASTFLECWQVYHDCCGNAEYKDIAIEALKKASLNATTTGQFIFTFREAEDLKLKRVCLRGARRVSENEKDIAVVSKLVQELQLFKELNLCKIKAAEIKRRLLSKKIQIPLTAFV